MDVKSPKLSENRFLSSYSEKCARTWTLMSDQLEATYAQMLRAITGLSWKGYNNEQGWQTMTKM